MRFKAVHEVQIKRQLLGHVSREDPKSLQDRLQRSSDRTSSNLWLAFCQCFISTTISSQTSFDSHANSSPYPRRIEQSIFRTRPSRIATACRCMQMLTFLYFDFGWLKNIAGNAWQLIFHLEFDINEGNAPNENATFPPTVTWKFDLFFQ